MFLKTVVEIFLQLMRKPFLESYKTVDSVWYLMLLQERYRETERQCCRIDEFGRKALNVLRSVTTTSHVSDAEARLEKLCSRTRTIRPQLADRCN